MLSKLALTIITALALVVEAKSSLLLKTTGPDSVTAVYNLHVVTTLTNTGDDTLKLLNHPGTVLSKLPTHNFDITHESGARPSFRGVLAKYSQKTAVEKNVYTVLSPGQTITVEHDLGQAYNFTTSGEGKYDIGVGTNGAITCIDYSIYFPSSTFRLTTALLLSTIGAQKTFYVVNSDSTVSPIEAQVSAHSAKVSGHLSVAPTPHSIVKRANFVGCSADQQNEINAAIPGATVYVANSAAYMSVLFAGTPRYTTWFGVYDAGRRNIVNGHFQQILTNDFARFTYDCTCNLPDTFGVIHFCPVFWNSPTLGTDSKAGTIVHEASHFTFNGGTDDVKYGQPPCEALAITDPDSAVRNADSHEFFAENNPPLL
ncbi:zincin [Agrocybe pediades]|nr:zincin [Agrocybe pediades]